ncbi:MAG: ROK family glucokinase [Planctomycetes bacterium]|nr:ROK family glucokinase [Planctomycetota bacterium]
MTIPLAIGIDLGGTNLKIAVVDREGRILAKEVAALTTGTGPEAVVANATAMVDRLLVAASAERSEIVGVGLGTPGPLNLAEGRVVKAVNLPGWQNVPIRDRFAEALELPVALDNDGNAAAYGEYWVGAGCGAGDLVMLTLGSGVGCGVIIGGKVLHGHFDNAAELGHMIVVPDGLPCRCGQRGCLEQYASAGGVARRTRAAVQGGESSTLAGATGQMERIDAARVVAAAQTGDSLAARIWDEACYYLAIACVNIQHAYNPERIVLGGGMSQAGSFLLKPVQAHLAQQQWSLCDDVPAVTLATLGFDAGVIGAAGLVWQLHNRAN